MQKAKSIQQSQTERGQIPAPEKGPNTPGLFVGILSLLMKFKKPDMTVDDWQRLEFRKGLSPYPARDVVNQFRGGI